MRVAKWMLGTASIALTIASAAGMTLTEMTQIPVDECPEDDYFKMLYSRPGCTYECYAYSAGLLRIYSEVTDAMGCDQSLSGAMLQQYWDDFFEATVRQTTCSMTSEDGVERLCVSATTIMKIFNEVLDQCYGIAGETPSQQPNVLTCNSENTFPFKELQIDEELMDGPLEAPPIENHTRCEQPNQCTQEEVDLLAEYYHRMIHHTNLWASLSWERAQNMRDIAHDFQQQANQESNGDLRNQLLNRKNYYLVRVNRIEASARDYETMAQRYGIDLDRVRINYNVARLEVAAEVREEEQEEEEEVQMASLKTTSHTTSGCVQNGSSCDTHNWATNVYVNDECLSVCVHRMFRRSNPSFLYCLTYSTQSGYTNKNCHANIVTRRLCFEDIVPF